MQIFWPTDPSRHSANVFRELRTNVQSMARVQVSIRTGGTKVEYERSHDRCLELDNDVAQGSHKARKAAITALTGGIHGPRGVLALIIR